MSTTTLRRGVSRQAIIDAAAEVFTVNGYEDSSVQDLLSRSGISRRTFYKYFRSKSDVLTALYKHVTGELIVNIVGASADTDDPLAGLRIALDKYLQFHVRNHAIARILVEEAMRSTSPLWSHRRQFRRALVHMLDRAITAATGCRLDPYVFQALVSGLEGLSLDLLIDGPPTTAELDRANAAIVGLLDATIAGAGHLPERVG